MVAACALGTAAALKLIPALLGVLYLRDIFSSDAAARKRMIYGIVVLFWGAWRRDRLLVVIGMMLAARNMMTYGLLYLIPVFFLEGDRWRRIDLLAFFILFVPLQIVWIRFGYVYSANPFLVNVTLLFLPFLRQQSPLSERTRRNQDESYQQPGELSTAPSATQPKGNTDMNKKEITEKRNKLQGDCG